MIFYQDRLGTNIGEIKRGAFLQFENMGEMTKAAVSSIEMKFANLLAKVECEYATQGQLKSMAEAVRETLLLNTSFLHATRSVYQDRLGTHIRRETLRKSGRFVLCR